MVFRFFFYQLLKVMSSTAGWSSSFYISSAAHIYEHVIYSLIELFHVPVVTMKTRLHRTAQFFVAAL